MRTERVILSGLLKLEKYRTKVVPHMKKEYFSDRIESCIFGTIYDYFSRYKAAPTIDDISVELSESSNLSDTELENSEDILKSIFEIQTNSEEWLLKTTEDFCQDKSLYNAIKTSIEIVDDPRKNRNSILEVLKDALSVSFDKDLGHDYVEDYEARFRSYHEGFKDRIPFDITLLNDITNGGIPAKTGTLNLIMAGTNVGKTLFLVHYAAQCLCMGYKVAYFSMEMDETELSKRIDASLLNIDINDLEETPIGFLNDRFKKIQCDKIKGQMKIKRFPTGRASTIDFDSYLSELRLQDDFVPDIIFVDYIGITASSTLPQSAKQNSYLYFKSVAEELRAFGIDHSAPVFSAVQTNRQGFADSDPDLDKTSDSFGIMMTSDFAVAMLTNDELERLNQYQMKQLKSRYNQKTKNKRFMVGYDLSRMRIFDVSASAQTSGLPPVQSNDADTIAVNTNNRTSVLDFGKIKV